MGSAGINIYEGNKPFVFVSYARNDQSLIKPYLEQLSLMHVRFWYDSGITQPSEWNEVIEGHIRKCSIVLVFATSNSLSSKAVKHELNTANYTLGKPVMPIFMKKEGYISLLPDGLLWLNNMQCRFLDQTGFAQIIKKDIPSKCKGMDASPSDTSSPSMGIVAVPMRVNNFKMPEIIKEFVSELKENIRCNRAHKAYADSQEFLNNLFVLFLNLFEFREPLRTKVKAFLESDTYYAKGCEIVINDVLNAKHLYGYFASLNAKANNVKHPDGSKQSAMDLKEFCDHYNDLLAKFDLFLVNKLHKNINLFRPLTVNYKKVVKDSVQPAPQKKPDNDQKPANKPEKKKTKIREWDIALNLNEKDRTAINKGFFRTSVKVTLLLVIDNPNKYELKKAEVIANFTDGDIRKTFEVHNGENIIDFELSWSNKEIVHKIVFEASVKYRTGTLRWPEKTAKATVTF